MAAGVIGVGLTAFEASFFLSLLSSSLSFPLSFPFLSLSFSASFGAASSSALILTVGLRAMDAAGLELEATGEGTLPI